MGRCRFVANAYDACVLPVTVSFTLTPAEWQEARRTARVDQRSARLCTIFVVVLFYGVARFAVLLLTPGKADNPWDIIAGTFIGCFFLLYVQVRQLVRSVARRRQNALDASNALPPLSGAPPAVAAPPLFTSSDAFSKAAPPTSLTAERTLCFSPASIDYKTPEDATVLQWRWLGYSETKTLFVTYFLANAFGFLPLRVRSILPTFLLMSSSRVQVIPIPKRAFVCIPDINFVRELLIEQSFVA